VDKPVSMGEGGILRFDLTHERKQTDDARAIRLQPLLGKASQHYPKPPRRKYRIPVDEKKGRKK